MVNQGEKEKQKKKKEKKKKKKKKLQEDTKKKRIFPTEKKNKRHGAESPECSKTKAYIQRMSGMHRKSEQRNTGIVGKGWGGPGFRF